MAEKHALIADPAAMYTQAEPLKKVNESAKNLMSGDFEREFRGGKSERRGRRGLAVLGAGVAALALWLLALTLVRELQLARLRREVDELRANLVAVSAAVRTLQAHKQNDYVKGIEDTIYADDDDIPGYPYIGKKRTESVEQLGDVTVLESDRMPVDDDDMYDDEDVESGGWSYHDYDRRPADGSTNMVHLKPEDFVEGTKLSFADSEYVQEIKRMINENPENPNIAISTTTEAARNKRSVFPEGEDLEAPEVPAAFSKPEERRKTKKFTPPVEPAPPAPHTVTRTVRSDEQGSRKPFIAAHFHGNTSHLSTERHEHYKGNGLVRVSHGAPHDVWYPSRWTMVSPHPRPTLTRNGHVHVHHTGVYLVYVQIYYLDSHDIISWVLQRTNAEIEGRETLLQCAQSSHSPEPMDKPNSCFSASALFLKAGDRLAVRNTGGDRHSLMQSEKSFIGLIKLADAEDPTEEF